MSENSPERWRHILSIFGQAVALPPEERASFLEAACDEDADLRARINEFLESSHRLSGFLEKPLLSDASSLLRQAADLGGPAADARATPEPATATTHSLSTSGAPGEPIGPYRLLQKIAEGGMGEVYLAEQGRLPEAEKLCRETLESQRKVLSKDHPDTLHTEVLLASIAIRAGRKQEALDTLQRAADAGLVDEAVIQEDESFRALRDDPGFRRIVELAAKNFQEEGRTK